MEDPVSAFERPASGEEGRQALEREARLPLTGWQQEVDQGLRLGLDAADSIVDRRISTFSRGELPHFAGINTFLKAPYLKDVRLADAADRLPRELSGGMQQFLHTLWQRTGLSVLLITHDIDEALLLAQEVHIPAPSPGRIVRSLVVDFDRSDLERLRLSTPVLSLRHEVAGSLRQLSREPC